MAGPAYGTNVGLDTTFLTDIDLTGDQLKFVVLGSDGLDVCGAGALATGVCQDSPVGTVELPLASEVSSAQQDPKVHGAFNPATSSPATPPGSGGSRLHGATVFTGTPDTVSGSQVDGIALQPGASGSITARLFRPSGLSA